MPALQRPIPVIILAGIAALFCVCSCALADKIYLKNNEIMEGTIVKETPTEITLDFGFGQTVLDRTNIVKIEKGPFPEKKDQEKGATPAKPVAAAKPQPTAPQPIPAKHTPVKPTTKKQEKSKEGMAPEVGPAGRRGEAAPAEAPPSANGQKTQTK